jgi:hypothetical protein
VDDLQNFIAAIDHLFSWFEGGHHRYLAPYFPLIQSSGMGKSKLLFEARKHFSSQQNTTVHHLLCVNSNTFNLYVHNKEKSRMTQLTPPVNSTENESSRFRRLLESLLPKKGKHRVILLFDESQNLIKHQALGFHVIRWWIREVHSHQVVAVFTGTSSKLMNFIEVNSTTDVSRVEKVRYYNDNDNLKKLYDPFYLIHTSGLFSTLAEADLKKYHADITFDERDEQLLLDNSKLYGRPLFSLSKTFTEEENKKIFHRVLCSKPRFCDLWILSVFGIRFQLSPSTLAIASELVSSSYALLVDYKAEAQNLALAYPPDPIVASFAASMMTETFELDNIKGISQSTWVDGAYNLLERSMACLDKGEVGEFAAAMYCLFVGDIIRERRACIFSYPLTEFFFLLLSPPQTEFPDYKGSLKKHGTAQLKILCTRRGLSRLGEKEELISRISKHDALKRTFFSSPSSAISLSLSAIQFCRSSVRTSLNAYCSPKYLKWCYGARVGIYFPTNFKAFDLMLPVRLINGSVSYFPLLISVKAYASICPSLIQGFFEEMEMSLEGDKEEGCEEKVVCPVISLLVFVGLPSDQWNKIGSLNYDEFFLTHDDITNFRNDLIGATKSKKKPTPRLMKAIAFPENDDFHIGKLLSLTSNLCEEGGRCASAPFYKTLGCSETQNSNKRKRTSQNSQPPTKKVKKK